jgi:hypothetical protein
MPRSMFQPALLCVLDNPDTSAVDAMLDSSALILRALRERGEQDGASHSPTDHHSSISERTFVYLLIKRMYTVTSQAKFNSN